MKPYQKEWLESDRVKDFLQDSRGPRKDPTGDKNACLGAYAANYHYSWRSRFAKGERNLLWMTIILRLISAIIKRAAVESIFKGQYVWLSFYCVGEVAAMAAIILAALTRQRSTFTPQFWLLVCLLAGIISDTVSAAFSNGRDDETIDKLNYASVAIKTCFEILKNAPACILLYRKVVGMANSATPAAVVHLLRDTPLCVHRFDDLPGDEKTWAYKAIMDKLCEDPEPRARDVEGESPNIPTGDSSGSLLGERHDIFSFMRAPRHRSPETLLPV